MDISTIPQHNYLDYLNFLGEFTAGRLISNGDTVGLEVVALDTIPEPGKGSQSPTTTGSIRGDQYRWVHPPPSYALGLEKVAPMVIRVMPFGFGKDYKAEMSPWISPDDAWTWVNLNPPTQS